MDKKTFYQIKKDFAWVRKDSRVLAVLLFGSTVADMHHRKSDIDLALVAPGLSHFYYSCKNISNESVNASDLLRKVFRKVNTSIRNYDVHLFEELPLNMQINIIHHHKIVYTADKPGMFEYFYHYRKRWDDQKHRNTISKDQLISSL
mgnify:FL=1